MSKPSNSSSGMVPLLKLRENSATLASPKMVTFHLKRPQASLLAMLATGWSLIYPCHVSPQQLRLHPIGTGPFKFVEFKPNESITVTRNPD
jgi:peptide/nickel transport system substrate-binding protein